MATLRLVSHHLCPYVQRAAIALAEKGVPHERVAVDLAAVAAALNGRPRKTLDWRTPDEALDDVLRSAQTGIATTS